MFSYYQSLELSSSSTINSVYWRNLTAIVDTFKSYKKSYLFWFFYVGFSFVFLICFGFFSNVSFLEGSILFVPLLLTTMYTFLSLLVISGEIFSHMRQRVTSNSNMFNLVQLFEQPGIPALWISIANLLLVGVLCISQIKSKFESVVFYDFLVLDALSVPFVMLTVSLAPLVVLSSLDTIRKNQYLYYNSLLLLFSVLGLCFCVTHFLVFYVLFEILGFPMFVLIGMYGPRSQRIDAAYKFFIYTFVGSAFILPVLAFFYLELGSTNYDFLVGFQFTEFEQCLFFAMTMFPFAVKVPVMPVHLWLPEAHVEAPTPVSMILAALLLKTGGYAFLRFIIPVFPFGVYAWLPILNTVAIMSIFFGSIYALVQVDLKRMIAYASVAHMSLVFMSLFSGYLISVQGSVYLMLAHGYISAGLFAGIGIIYDRYHTRTIRYYGGLSTMMPLFAIGFFILTLGNLSFPFTGGFTGEFMILFGLTQKNSTTALMAGSTVFLSLCYSVWLYNRVFYGIVNHHIQKHQDLTPVEVCVLGWCVLFTLGLGFFGGYFCEYSQDCYTQLINQNNLY